MTHNLPIDQINGERLDALRTEGVREGRQLEYKEQLPGNTDEEKREFLSDVSAFANAAGGDLIYGIRERRDGENRTTGEIDEIVGLPGLNVDAERLRLEASIRSGIDPRMPPVLFHEIQRGSGPPCLLLRVTASWAGPHMVTFKNLSRFYARTSGGKYQLAVSEIRAAFLAAETAYERVRRARSDRVMKVAALETPVPVGEGGKVILHALPIARSDEVWQRALAIGEHELTVALPPIISGVAHSRSFNLDGFLTYTEENDLARRCYLQLFRDGGIETLGPLWKDRDRGGFYGWGPEQAVINAFTQYRSLWDRLGVTPPLLVGLALSGVKGWKLLAAPWPYGERDAALERDVVVTPEVIVSDLNAPPDVALRPLFDFVWNGGGWPASPNYKDGRWVRPT